MSIQRALRRGAQTDEKDEDIGAATVRIYKLLWEGAYMNAAGQRVNVNGDISKNRANHWAIECGEGLAAELPLHVQPACLHAASP